MYVRLCCFQDAPQSCLIPDQWRDTRQDTLASLYVSLKHPLDCFCLTCGLIFLRDSFRVPPQREGVSFSPKPLHHNIFYLYLFSPAHKKKGKDRSERLEFQMSVMEGGGKLQASNLVFYLRGWHDINIQGTLFQSIFCC